MGQGGHRQVEILQVGLPLDLRLADGEGAGAWLDLGFLPRHGPWLTCHRVETHFTIKESLQVMRFMITSQVVKI